MKIPKEARKLSRTLFRDSLTAGRIDPAKVEAIVRGVIAKKPRHTLGVLKGYQKLVRLELARRHAVLESATPLDPQTAEDILRDLRARFGADITHEFKVTPELLGGIRIQLGSDVWDGSVSGRLQRLQTALDHP